MDLRILTLHCYSNRDEEPNVGKKAQIYSMNILIEEMK